MLGFAPYSNVLKEPEAAFPQLAMGRSVAPTLVSCKGQVDPGNCVHRVFKILSHGVDLCGIRFLYFWQGGQPREKASVPRPHLDPRRYRRITGKTKRTRELPGPFAGSRP
jgi:hypothetical protein